MIDTIDLNKKYGDLFAVKALTLKLNPGDVFGFIGPNGRWENHDDENAGDAA